MAEQYFTNQRIIFGALAIEGQSNSVSLAAQADVRSRSDLGSDWAKRAPGGVKDASFGAAGYFDGGPVDGALTAALDLAAQTVIVTQPQAAEGSVAYFLRALAGSYTPYDGEHGDLAEFDMEAAASGIVVRGRLAADRTITGAVNTAYQTLQAVADGRALYAAVAVLSLSDGASLDIDIEHSDGAGGQTQAISFAGITEAGAWFASSDAETAQTGFRAAFDLSGDDPAAEIIVAIGVQ